MAQTKLENVRFGRLTVLKKHGANPHGCAIWKCRCDCGNETFVKTSSLNNGKTRSCGCLQKETRKIAAIKHGGGGTRLYYCWDGMLSRCYKTTNKRFERYGGRGISVCKEWQDFANFRDWALSNGYTDTLTIDRVDNDGNYEPSNCRWATQKEQANNRSSSNTVACDPPLDKNELRTICNSVTRYKR